MKGGHGDNYVYQLAAFVRWLKGAERPVSASQPAVMPHDLGLAAETGAETTAASSPWWSAVLPVFLDTVNDTQWRSHPGFGNSSLYYTDTSTVDDLCEAQLAVDQPAAASSLVFRVAACEAFNALHSNSSTPPPLSLFLLSWSQTPEPQPSPPSAALTMGYLYKVNVTERQLYTADGDGGWRAVSCQLTVKWDARQLIVSVPLLAVFPALTPAAAVSTLIVEQKWWSGSDWAVQLTDAIDFMVSGDAAPNARFNYRWEANVTLAPQPRQEVREQ